MKKSFGRKALIFPTPVWCIGSYDKEGKPNIMTAAWGGICCSSPPCVTVSLREATLTYSNIMATQAYTINVPSRKFADVVDFIGMVSGAKHDKFEETGLTPVKAQYVNAPFVDEFPMILECRVIHTYAIGLHTQFIGEIADVRVDEDLLDSDGKPDIAKVDPFVFAPESRSYLSLGDKTWKAFDSRLFKKSL
jgi:flavin reductase (DIM6/NTAB) family NADH-FMN oxidoreductase RutF